MLVHGTITLKDREHAMHTCRHVYSGKDESLQTIYTTYCIAAFFTSIWKSADMYPT